MKLYGIDYRDTRSSIVSSLNGHDLHEGRLEVKTLSCWMHDDFLFYKTMEVCSLILFNVFSVVTQAEVKHQI
jgi:hypothetical protein